MLKQFFYNFGGGGRKLEKIRLGLSRDFTNNQLLHEQFKNMRNDNMLDFQQEFRLSKALDTQERVIFRSGHYSQPNEKELNQYLRKEYVQQVRKGVSSEVPDENAMEDRTLKWQENRIMIEEAKKFSQVYFKKNEINRLQLKEVGRPSNYLPEDRLVGEMDLKDLKTRSKNFQQNVNGLQNQRVKRLQDSLDGLPVQANIYGHLVRSQVLGLGDEVRNRLMMLIPMNKQEIVANDPSLQQKYLPSKQYTPQEIVDLVLEGVDLTKNIVDIDSLITFIQCLQDQNVEQQESLDYHFQEHQQIINYQEYLFDKFRTNDINMRTQGKLHFNMLSEPEQLNYIKYTIDQPEIVLKATETLMKTTQATPKVYSQLLQRLSCFKPENQLTKLAILNDYRYRNLLRQVSTDLETYDDETLAQSILALSRFSPTSFSQILPRMSTHMFRKITNEIIERLSYIDIGYLSMILRSFHQFPFSMNTILQTKIAKEIEIRSQQDLGYYEIESFLIFMNNCYPNKDYNQTIIELAKRFTQSIKKEWTKSFDNTSLKCFTYTITKISSIGDKKQLQQMVGSIQDELISYLPKVSIEDLSQMALMLSQISMPPNNQLVIKAKKTIIDALSLKNKEVYDESIAKAISSFAIIDTQRLFGDGIHINNILQLQSTFQRFTFIAQSPKFIPYSKVLKQVLENRQAFSRNSLALILKTMLLIRHQNRDAVFQIMNLILERNPTHLKLEQDYLNLDQDQISTAVYTYSLMNYKDQFFLTLMKTIFDRLKIDCIKKIAQFQVLNCVLQSQFHLNYNQNQREFLENISVYILDNIQVYIDGWTFHNSINFLYFYLALHLKNKNKQNQYFFSENSLEIIEMLFEKILIQQSLLSSLSLESKYILSLIDQIIMVIPDLKDFQNKFQNQFGQNPSKLLLEYQQKINDEYISSIGTERLTIKQIHDEIVEELRSMNINIIENKYIVKDDIALMRSDIFLVDFNKAISFISVNSLNENNFDDKTTFHLNGQEQCIRILSKELFKTDLKYIVLEEYSRVTEQKLLDPQCCRTYLKDKLKL